MKITKHIQERMSERCINEMMLEIVQNFGVDTPDGERMIIDKKALTSLEKWTRNFLKQLELMKQRGGLTLVSVEGSLLTVFANNSYRKNAKGA
jgi:hypothetical protein